jgi:guanylate kinase
VYRKPLREGELFIVSAPSGTGKTTLCRKLSSIVPRLKHSVSYTTRLPRKGEINNVHYTFVSEKKFKTMINKGEFAEWAVVHGNLYGTSIKRLIELNRKGYDIILDIDTQGARQMKRRFKDAVYIFVLPPSMKVLEKRLKSRMSESVHEIRKRLEKAKEEILNYKNYDYVIINDRLKKAVKELESIVIARRLRIKEGEKWI